MPACGLDNPDNVRCNCTSSHFLLFHTAGGVTMPNLLREHAEQQHALELHELLQADTHARPPQWKLSPWAVATFLLGGALENGFVITPKYIGDRRLVEIATAPLATDRALLLLGVPGT